MQGGSVHSDEARKKRVDCGSGSGRGDGGSQSLADN